MLGVPAFYLADQAVEFPLLRFQRALANSDSVQVADRGRLLLDDAPVDRFGVERDMAAMTEA